jgi:intein/homing endonuclease
MEALTFNRISSEVAESLNYLRPMKGPRVSLYAGLFAALQDGPVLVTVKPGVDPRKFADRLSSGLYKLGKEAGVACRVRLLADGSSAVVSLKPRA